MLYGLLLTLFILLCFFIILIILVQKSRSSMGMGAFGGSTQVLFGGSGGQDLFQKVTWVCITLFMSGSLLLAIMNSAARKNLSYTVRPKAASTQPMQMPEQPTEPSTSEQQESQTTAAADMIAPVAVPQEAVAQTAQAQDANQNEGPVPTPSTTA